MYRNPASRLQVNQSPSFVPGINKKVRKSRQPPTKIDKRTEQEGLEERVEVEELDEMPYEKPIESDEEVNHYQRYEKAKEALKEMEQKQQECDFFDSLSSYKYKRSILNVVRSNLIRLDLINEIDPDISTSILTLLNMMFSRQHFTDDMFIYAYNYYLSLKMKSIKNIYDIERLYLEYLSPKIRKSDSHQNT